LKKLEFQVNKRLGVGGISLINNQYAYENNYRFQSPVKGYEFACEKFVPFHWGIVQKKGK
jgi:hypothetical protein